MTSDSYRIQILLADVNRADVSWLINAAQLQLRDKLRLKLFVSCVCIMRASFMSSAAYQERCI